MEVSLSLIEEEVKIISPKICLHWLLRCTVSIRIGGQNLSRRLWPGETLVNCIAKIALLLIQISYPHLIDMLSKINYNCNCIYFFAALYIQGNDVTKFASMSKLKAGKLARQVTDQCLQYWGGMGFTNEVLVSRLYR